MPEVITVQKAAELLGVDPDEVEELIASGRLSLVKRTRGGLELVEKSQVVSLLRQRRARPKER